MQQAFPRHHQCRPDEDQRNTNEEGKSAGHVGNALTGTGGVDTPVHMQLRQHRSACQ